MDWTPDETQQMVSDLGRQVLSGADRSWGALIAAGLHEVEGLAATVALLVEVGRTASPIPALETLVLGAPLRAAGLVGPEAVLTAGLRDADGFDPRRPTLRVVDGRATGEKVAVPALDQAAFCLLPAEDGLYAVDLQGPGVERLPGQGTHDAPLGSLRLCDAPVVKLGDVAARDRYLLVVDVGICALLLGLSQEALAMTARYVSEREQFGRKIGTFQAVSQRAADAWIETHAMSLTLWSAVFRLESGLPAERAVAIARYTAAEGSHRVLASAQHLHGGMGFDRDYALHRYFLTAKAWEFVGGGASAQLARLGALLAASPGQSPS
jgi:alkylation response protein AidB-like acyl-CoA dehydrogenase